MAPSTQQHPPIRRAMSTPLLLLLSITLIASLYFTLPLHSVLSDDGNQPKLKGSVTAADRLPSWIREKAIDKLPLFVNPYSSIKGDAGEVEDALGTVQKWAAASSDSTETNVVDVITIGSVDRMEYMRAQQQSWASGSNHSVRNVFLATETNTDNAVVSNGGNCQGLKKVCQAVEASSSRRLGNNSTVQVQASSAASKNSNDEELCIGRRIGLAVGASVMRYRKIMRALTLGRQGRNESMADVKQYTTNTLPNYLIITFDSAYYNTEHLQECVGHGGENNNNAPAVYAPFTSRMDMALRDKSYEQPNGKKTSQSQQSFFSYPTNHTGVVFNKPALELWIRRISCFSAENSFSAPTPIVYDPKTHELEHKFCRWMDSTTTTTAESPSEDHDGDAFVSAIRGALDVSLSSQRNQTKTGGKTRREFAYSSRYHAVSISDLFSIYSSTMHLLCKNVGGGMGRIPSGEEILGYLIHQFGVSSGGLLGGALDTKSSCKASSISEECTADMMACANVSLQGLKDKI